jgi:hypothetical protein
MKQFIVLMAMIALGIFIYNLIAGGDGSLTEAVGKAMLEARA